MSRQAYQALVAERDSVAAEYAEAQDQVEYTQNGGGDNEGLGAVEAVFAAGSLMQRLERLERLIREAEVVEKEHDVVGIGATLTIDLGDGEETYRYETIAREGCIGSSSPLGKALYGRSAGEKIQVDTPNGTYTVSILRIS